VTKYYDFKFQLDIDGAPCQPETVSPLFQSDPWPGGHSFSCTISGPRLKKYFDYLPIGTNRPSIEEASRFFLSLGLQWPEGNAKQPNYFLNSVEELDFDGNQIKFSGVCSPIITKGDA
jgi:hypothetical protein